MEGIEENECSTVGSGKDMRSRPYSRVRDGCVQSPSWFERRETARVPYTTFASGASPCRPFPTAPASLRGPFRKI